MPDCIDPKVAGFEPQAIVYSYEDFMRDASLTTTNMHPEQITDVTIGQDVEDFGVQCSIYGENPYNGTNTALTREDGVEKYIHQVALRIAERGAYSGDEIVEPLARGRHIVVLKTNDGKVFVHGLYGVLKATEQTQNEYENNGDWMVTMQDKEPYAVVEVVGGDQTTAQAIFARLWNKAKEE